MESTSDSSDESLSIETLVVHAGRPLAAPDQPLNAPIVPASNFHGGGSLEYAREKAPTTSALESAIGALEHGHAIAFSSGMAAANAALDVLTAGAVVVAPNVAYSGVSARLAELAQTNRIKLRTVDVTDIEAIRTACEGADLLWLESPTNPLLEVADLPQCIEIARAAGALILVDNTFATPILQTPLVMGADIVMHSVSKALSGHSDLIMGALVASSSELAEHLTERRALLGAVPSAFDCFLALRGIRTLAVRIERGQASAKIIYDRLAADTRIERVRYPGFGTMMSIELAGGARAADQLCQSVRIWTFATSLGGVESLLERRRRWPQESDLVPEGLVRLSFGIEAVEDLWHDLDQALSL